MATEKLSVSIDGVDNLSPVLKSIESGVIRFVGAVSSALTVLSVIGFPVASAARFQQQLLEVKKTTDFTNQSLNTLKTGLVELSKTTNVSADELARIAALGGQMGVGEQGPAALLAFTEELSRAVTALDVSADQAAPALGKLVNIFNLPLGQFRNAVAVINELSNVSTATAEEILDVQRRIGDLGGSVSFAESAALSALAIDLGLTAETAGTTITKIFADMKSSAADFAAFMGTSTADWITKVNEDGVGAFRNFLERLNALPAEVAAAAKVELTGGGRIFEYVTKMQNQLRQGDSSRMAILIREANREWIDGTSAIKEQQNVLSGTIAQWDIFKNKVNATFVAGGDQALRAINDVLKSVGDTVSSPAFTQGFADFIENLVGMGQAVTAAFASLSIAGEGSQVDWGTLFDIAGLLAVVGVMKAIPTIFAAIQVISGSLQNSLKAANTVKSDGPLKAAIDARKEALAARQAIAAKEAAIDAVREAQITGLANVEQNLFAKQIALQQQRATVATNVAKLEANADAIRAARTAAIQRVATLEANYAERIRILTEQREAAQLSLNAAIESGNAAAIRSAQTQLRTVGRQIGGTNSYFSQAIARDRAQMERELATLNASYARAVDNMRNYGRASRASDSFLKSEIDQLRLARAGLMDELSQLNVQTVAAKRSWWAAFVQSMPSGPILSTQREVGILRIGIQSLTTSLLNMAKAATTAYRTLGLGGLVAAGWIRALVGLNAASNLVGRGFGLLSSLVSRFFIAWAIFDLASMIVDMLGWKDAIKSTTDEVIKWVNKMTGLELPTFGGADAAKAEADLIRQQLKNRERLYAQAEAFGKRFGDLKISTSLDDEGFHESLANMEKSLKQFSDRIREGGTFNSDTGMAPTEAFVEGVQGVIAFQTQIDALYEKMKELRELQEQDDANRLYDPSEVFALEQIAKTTGLTVIEQERLNELQRHQSDALERYLLRNEQLRQLDQQRNAVLGAQAQTLRASLSILDASAATDWFGGDQLLRRLRDQKQIVESLSASVNKMNADMGPDAQTGTVNPEDVKRLQELQSRLNEANRDLERYKRAFASTGATIKLAGQDAKSFTDALVSGDISGFFQAMTRDGALALGGLQRYLQGSGNVINTVKEQNKLASQLIFGREMARGYGIWANSARVAAEQAKNAVNQAVAQNKRDLEQLVTFFLDVDAKIKGNQQDAAAEPANRKVDAATDKKLFELDLEKQKKQEIIDLEEESGALTYRQAETRRFLLNQEFNERARKIREIGELQKANTLETRLRTNFGEQADEARALQREITNLTAKLNDPSLSNADRDALIAPLQGKTAELEAKLAQLKSTISSLSDIKPVGESIVVTEAELKPLKDVLTELTSKSGALKVEGLSGTQKQMESLANDLEAGRANAERMINSALDGLRRLAQESGVSAEAVASNIAAAFSDPRIQEAVTGIRERINSGLVDVAGIRYDPVKAAEDANQFATVWNQAMSGVTLVAPKLNIAQSLEGEAASVKAIIEGQLKDGIVVNVKEILAPEDTPSVDAEANVTVDKQKLQDSVQEGLKDGKFKVDVQANVQGGGNYSNRAGVPGYADGGHIRGAGTSRSDSILSWLSNGEYVMDALTVRMFGPGFFKFLQSIAKSGANLKESIPGFASGGFLGKMPSLVNRPAISSPAALPAILAPVIQNVTEAAEEVFLDISFNGKQKSRVKGSREQVRSLTDALMELKRSM